MDQLNHDADLFPISADGIAYEDPQGDVEQAIAGVWRDVFHLQRIGRNDNFFGLGGDSLLAMKLVEALAADLDVQLAVVLLFRNPTVRELAQLMTPLS